MVAKKVMFALELVNDNGHFAVDCVSFSRVALSRKVNEKYGEGIKSGKLEKKSRIVEENGDPAVDEVLYNYRSNDGRTFCIAKIKEVLVTE